MHEVAFPAKIKSREYQHTESKRPDGEQKRKHQKAHAATLYAMVPILPDFRLSPFLFNPRERVMPFTLEEQKDRRSGLSSSTMGRALRVMRLMQSKKAIRAQ